MEKEEFREQWKRASYPPTVNLNNKAFIIADYFSFFEEIKTKEKLDDLKEQLKDLEKV